MLIKMACMIVVAFITYGLTVLIGTSPSLTMIDSASLDNFKEKKVFNLDKATVEKLIRVLENDGNQMD